MKRYKQRPSFALVEDAAGEWVRYEDAQAAIAEATREATEAVGGLYENAIDKAVEAERETCALICEYASLEWERDLAHIFGELKLVFERLRSADNDASRAFSDLTTERDEARAQRDEARAEVDRQRREIAQLFAAAGRSAAFTAEVKARAAGLEAALREILDAARRLKSLVAVEGTAIEALEKWGAP